jgi:DnaJ-class molecular chaperone
MGKKDYYIILGVSRTETDQNIRRAFRRLAKTHHPDLAGQERTRRFQDIVEAYEVLSDGERRRQYNESLRRSEEGAAREPTGPLPEVREEPKPLISEPISLLRNFQTVRPSAHQLLERIVRNFTGIGVPKGEQLQGLNLEIVLSPGEARRGGIAEIEVPVFSPCPFCGGSGEEWLFPCSHCRGQGMVEDEETVKIRIPPMVKDGAIFELPLRDLGIHNLYLRLYIRIGDYE